MSRSVLTVAAVALLVGSAVGAGVALSTVGPAPPDSPGSDTGTDSGTNATDGPVPDSGAGVTGLDTFQNESAFETYVRRGNRLTGSRGFGGQAQFADAAVEGDAAGTSVAETAEGGRGGDGGSLPSRVATTNVQVESLDEPDILKTDGRQFYYAPDGRVSGPRPLRADGVGFDDVERALERADAETHVVDISQPDDPEEGVDLDTSGTLLRTGERLVVFESDRLAGYDVSDPADPTEAWSTRLNGSLVTAREQNGTVYVVTETPADPGACPVDPLGSRAIACEDIHRPGSQIPVDAVYSVLALDAERGEVRDSASFVGTARNSVVYVSPGAVYVTYTQSSSRAAATVEFLREEFDRAPSRLVDRVAEIQSYDIAPASKEREIRRAFDRWVATLPAENRESVRESVRAERAEFLGEHQRELTRTGVVRVEASGGALSVGATGSVPGRPLNQFSMDRHGDTLRIATTVPGVGAADSENDLYTLEGESLDKRGNVTGMGVTERVYSVRYVGDTAYVVTFRRVDPFHVVDLSDPENPRELGELKLPGFSSYLHPVDDDHVLGVGEENGKVKTVLFDVSDRSDPGIADARVLDRQWSAVADTHHAFLMDRKHGVFVLPAGQRSVVMNYTGGSLDLETTVTTRQPATRARYVDDSLYVFADESVAVVDETTWERTTTLRLD